MNTSTFSRLCLATLGLALTLSSAQQLQAACDLRVSGNGRYLEYMNGTPFYYLSDTQWRLNQHTDSQVIQILDDRRAKGYTVIQVGAINTPSDANGQVAFINGNVNQLNGAYWDRLLWIADRCAERGFHLFLVYGHPGRADAPIKLGSTAQAYEYGRLVGNHFRTRSNVIFCNGMDCDPESGIGMPGWRSIGEGMADGVNGQNNFNGSADYSTTMQSYHGAHKWNLPIGPLLQFEPWLDFYGQEVWHDNAVVYGVVNANYNLANPVKPSVMQEGSYEDEPISGIVGQPNPITPYYVRVEAYYSMFAGGCAGYCYGHLNSWASATDMTYINKPCSAQMGVMARMFTARQWWRFIPDLGMIASNEGSGSSRKVSLKMNDGSQCLVYFPTNSAGGVRLDRITTSNTVNASWMDPRNGATQGAGGYNRTDVPNFQPPGGWEDALLILTAGSGTPTPTPPRSPYSGSNIAIPGTILTAQYDMGGEGIAYHDTDNVNQQSSTYRPGSGVDSSDSGVGWIYAGEWLEYMVNVSAAGTYTITIPVCHQGNGGTMHVSLGGADVTGSLSVPNTGSWSTFQNITKSVNLRDGVQILRVAFDTADSSGYGPGLGDITISSGPTTTPGNQTPYNGSPMSIPGTINVAQYDNGGEGVAYHDVDAINYGSSSYRPGQGVDSAGSGVGWILGGEWLEYSVNISAAGAYTITIPVSQVAAGATMHVNFGGTNVTGTLTIPNTGNWSTSQNITASVNLSAGTQIMRVAFDANASNGYGPGLGDITISNGPTTTPGNQTPYSGSPIAVPGTILTSQYDNGGEGVAFHDVDASNLASGTYRTGLGVDSNGSGVGWIMAGEWLEYTVNVSAAGNYTIWIPVSQEAAGGTMHVSFNGVNKTGSMSIPNTGNWGVTQNISATVNLSAGVQVMQVAFDANASNGYGPGLGNIAITAPGGGTTGLTIPGSIAASNYEKGGEGVAYHDTDAANLMSSTFRPGEGVDADAGRGLGWVVAGEWTNYTVNVANAGNYMISMSVCSPGSGGTLHVEFGGVNKTGTMTVPNTGSWDVNQTISATVNLSAGTQVMRIRFDTNASSGFTCGLADSIVFTPTGNG